MPITAEGKARTGPVLRHGCHVQPVGVAIPADLLEELDAFAAEQRQVRSMVVVLAIRAYLQQQQRAAWLREYLQQLKQVQERQKVPASG